MTSLHFVLIGIYAVVLLVWISRYRLVKQTKFHTPTLTPRDWPFAEDHAPFVSVIIPAKDEEESIGDCVLSVLAQNHLRLEVIVIDDRSSDGTANVVREIASRDPRVRLVSTTGLPPGWTGKTNAVATGEREAKGDWLLFIDSDTRHEPENLSVVLEYARQEQADMVSILPRMRNATFWERVVQPFASVLLMLHFPFQRINDDADRDAGFANGQYILIRRTAYEAIGGHASVRDKFCEDIHLARVLKSHGFRVRVAMAPQISSCRMYTSLSELVQGWSRILYAAYDHSAWRLGSLLVGLAVFSLSSYAVLAVTATAWLTGHANLCTAALFAMSLAHLALQNAVIVQSYRISANQRRYAAFYCVAVCVMCWVLASALRKCYNHRLTWRGTSYARLEEQGPAPVILPFQASDRPAPAETAAKKSA